MPATPCRGRRGFTLMELLVVIGIIAVLAAIVLVAGGRVLASGKKNATRDVLVMLDAALDAYITEKGELPGAWAYVQVGSAADAPLEAVMVADARVGSLEATMIDPPDRNLVNSGGLFLLLAGQVPSAKSQVEGLPPKFLASRTIFNPPAAQAAAARLIQTPVDAWGNAIRFVLPAVDGLQLADINAPGGNGVSVDAQNFPPRKRSDRTRTPPVDIECPVTEIRRNNTVVEEGPVKYRADSDGGVCLGNRPYFYSAGEDGDPSTIEDNVYTTVPTITRK
jgi:prepilin-type N-terminal cleavage/methylation domain-containing protein